MALTAAAIVADRLSRPGAEVAALQSEVTRAGLWPRDPSEQLALLALVVLFGATTETAAATAAAVTTLRDGDGVTAVQFVAGLFRPIATMGAGIGIRPTLAIRATVYAELGDGLAVRVQFTCDDGLEVFPFTGDPGGYAPDRDLAPSLSMGLPGRLIYRMARDLAEVGADA